MKQYHWDVYREWFKKTMGSHRQHRRKYQETIHQLIQALPETDQNRLLEPAFMSELITARRFRQLPLEWRQQPHTWQEWMSGFVEHLSTSTWRLWSALLEQLYFHEFTDEAFQAYIRATINPYFVVPLNQAEIPAFHTRQ